LNTTAKTITSVPHTNQYKLTQTGLIDKILKATGMEDCNAKPTPCSADGKPLGTDSNGTLAKADWSYPSVVGMLLYLAGNSQIANIIALSTQNAEYVVLSQSCRDLVLIHEMLLYLAGKLNFGLASQLLLNPRHLNTMLRHSSLAILGS
jgi:hypothetical protein